jgi:hypothetical protein
MKPETRISALEWSVQLALFAASIGWMIGYLWDAKYYAVNPLEPALLAPGLALAYVSSAFMVSSTHKPEEQ